MIKHHGKLERNSILMLLFTVVAISVGGIVEIVPLFRTETTIEPVRGMRPYTPLELAGFNVYLKEGCYNCHSQQIRPLRDEVERYGHYSLAAESMYDHPFQWGSKRTGPDLARVGGKYSDDWHYAHMVKPQALVPESIMPPYPHLTEKVVNFRDIDKHMRALKTVGVPYTEEQIDHAQRDANAQAADFNEGQDGLFARYGSKVNARNFDGAVSVTEMDALIAYLQMLGTLVDLKNYDPEMVVAAPAEAGEGVAETTDIPVGDPAAVPAVPSGVTSQLAPALDMPSVAIEAEGALSATSRVVDAEATLSSSTGRSER